MLQKANEREREKDWNIISNLRVTVGICVEGIGG